MIDNATFSHIGYVTDSIERTSKVYVEAGYEPSPLFVDEIQRTRICFLRKDRMPVVELVEPADEKSSVNKILNKCGVSPYHVCFEVDDVVGAVEEMTQKHSFIALFRPVEAVAFENRLICYLFRKEVGYIELVSRK